MGKGLRQGRHLQPSGAKFRGRSWPSVVRGARATSREPSAQPELATSNGQPPVETPPLAPSCERARFRVSLLADEELSSSETRLLRGHLRVCPPCASYASAVDGLASMIRHEPLVNLGDGPFDAVGEREAG